MTADLRTQFAEALPHEDWCHHDMDCCGCTCLDGRWLAVGPLMPVVERIAAAARAEGAAEALRDAADDYMGWLDRSMLVSDLRVRAALALASLSPTVTPTTEENPK